MKHLCLREQDQWKSDREVLETIATGDAFLREHLGSWEESWVQRQAGSTNKLLSMGILTKRRRGKHHA